MKKLFLFGLFGLCVTNAYADRMEAQFRTWKSSQLQCGNYSNVLISSTPIIFHMVIGSPTLNNGGNNYFVMARSSAFPYMANIVSTKAFVPLEQSNHGLGQTWDVITSTSYGFNDYAYIAKQGGACPVFYLWDYWSFSPIQTSNRYFPKD